MMRLSFRHKEKIIMKSCIIPIFVVYKGCPNRCIYCNERITAGNHPDRISEDLFHETVRSHIESTGSSRDGIQIAFYGGNFTGIERDYQEELLKLAEGYVKKGWVNSIRISTRPDYVDRERIDLLKRYSVKTVEIGAQSMNDDVLHRSKRGHTASDVRRALVLLKENGFETGVHLMAGLPGDTRDGFYRSVEEIINLRPHTVRVHPTIVFKDTPLAQAYIKGQYRPLTLDEAVELCEYSLLRFREEGINLIRLGLQHTHEMEASENIVAGPYHPAFRSLVEGSIFLKMAIHLFGQTEKDPKEATFSLAPKDVSSFRGMRNGNMKTLKERFGTSEIMIREYPEQDRGLLVLTADGKRYRTSFAEMKFDQGLK
jgi:histone acetyltransferase (RNA polymerase elongator complex component)